MTALVTGSSGFIGSHLVDKLIARGERVIGYDINPPKYSEVKSPLYTYEDGSVIDLSNLSNIAKKYNVDIIYHLAGMLGTHELVDNAIKATKINVIGTLNVLEVCRQYKIKLLEVSKPNCWVNTYTITKIAAESFVEMYRNEFGVQSAIVKWFNVYGSRQPLYNEAGYTKFIPTAIVSALKNEDILIYGNGKQTIDLVHTVDTINSTLAIVDNWDKCEGEIFEVGDVEISVNVCAELIKKLTNSKSNIVHIPMRKGETENTEICANNSLLFEKTNYANIISLEDGLYETIQWYKKEYNL